MEQSKIDRINALAKKAKTEGLTAGEAQEQAKLRKEYIESFKMSLRGILDNSYIENPDGTRKKVERKKK